MMEKLKTHCQIISGYAFKSSDLKEEGAIPVIKIGNISNGGNVIIDDATQYVDSSFLTLDQKYHVNKGDILITLTGSHMNQPNSMVGRTCRSYDHRAFLLNQRAGKVICNAGTDAGYVYYLLITKAIKEDIVNRAYGAANQVNVSPSDVMDIKWEFHRYAEQQKISAILSTYDNLIEINNKRIKVLEQMAENLYKEWFVRFRFPGHEDAEFEDGIPKGWERKRADEAIYFNPTIKAGDQSLFTIIPMEALSTTSMVLDSSNFVKQDAISGRRSQNGDTLLAKITPCLENGKTGFVMGMPDHEVFGGSTEFVVLRSKTLTSHYVYCIARSHYFRQTAILSMNGADGRQRVDEDKLKSTKIVQPEKSVLDQFEKIVSPIFDEVLQLTQKNSNLIKQRDLLLPRLMSGKLEV